MSGVDMEAKQTSASRMIKASAEEIFAIVSDASRHPEIDGSGTVQATRGKSEPLTLGSKFGASVKLGPLPYRITNKVVEYDENRLIAWQHFGKHRWRYELEPVDGGTMVTETFDWSTSTSPMVIEKAGYPNRHLGNIEQTLEKLAQLVEA